MSIGAFVQDACRQNAERTLITDSAGRNIRYDAFAEGVAYASAQMRHLSKGERFSIALPNCAEFLYLLFGGIDNGCIAVNLNPQMSAGEFEYRLRNADVSELYTTHSVFDNLKDVLDRLGIRCILVGGGIEELKMPTGGAGNLRVIDFNRTWETSGEDAAPGLRDPGEIAFFQYTGGTTGTIKAATISHGNVLASIGQMGGYLSERLNQGQEVFMVTFPFYHVFSIVFQVLMAMGYGSRIILYPYVRDLEVLSGLMKKEPFTVFVGVHTLYKWMLQNPDFRSMRFPSAKIFIAGAEHIQPETKARWLEQTGHLIVEGYGLTETSALVSMSLLDASLNDMDSIGLPLPDTEMKLMDEAGNLVEGPNAEGEIWVRGPQVVNAYWNNPDDTASAFSDGWLKTGDMAVKKANGQFRIVGRKKDMINVSGFNVYPSEVETVLMQFPGIEDCAVTGVPDDRSGERVAAFVVSSRTDAGEEIVAFCKDRLSAYKVPVVVRFIDNIPKSAVGKTLRRALVPLLEEKGRGASVRS